MNAVSRLNIVAPVCRSHARSFGQDAQGARDAQALHGKRQEQISPDRAARSLASSEVAYQDETIAVAPSRNASRLNAAFIAQVLGQVLPGPAPEPRRGAAYTQPRTFPSLCEVTL